MADEKPGDINAKLDDIAAKAMEAGQKFVTTDAGRTAAGAADAIMDTADDLARKAADSTFGRKALDSDAGRQAAALARQADGWTKSTMPNALVRNVAIGAGAGAVASIVLPFGPLLWAAAGAGLAYLRTVSKKN